MGWLSNAIKTVSTAVATPVKYVAKEVDDAFYTKKEREADEAAAKAAAEEAKRLEDEANLEKIQERLAGITAGTIEIDPRVVDEREADAWLTGLFNPMDSIGAQNDLTMEQRNMARIIDNRFEYDWDIHDESAFVLYNRLKAEQDESAHVSHTEDRAHTSDRADDAARPADQDENATGLTADDARPIYAPTQDKPQDFYGTGGADPDEEEPDSFLEGWFDNIFSLPTNNPNDAISNGDPDRSMGEKATIVAIGGLTGALIGVIGGTLAGANSQNYAGVVTISTVTGGVAGVVMANN